MDPETNLYLAKMRINERIAEAQARRLARAASIGRPSRWILRRLVSARWTRRATAPTFVG
jgi:hypothetical protein